MPLFALAQDDATEEKFGAIQSIRETVREKTPDFITEPFFFVINKLEGFRTDLLAKTEARKLGTKLTLDGETIATTSEFLDAFKYLEIFILIIVIFILSVKLIFYGALVFLLLLLGRLFWYRFY